MKSLILLLMIAGFQSNRQSDSDVFAFTRRWIGMQHSMAVKGGVIPDAHTCILVSDPILRSIFGDRVINNELPLRAKEENGIWTVIGTFHGKGFGGTAVLQIRKTDGKVLFVNHSE